MGVDVRGCVLLAAAAVVADVSRGVGALEIRFAESGGRVWPA